MSSGIRIHGGVVKAQKGGPHGANPRTEGGQDSGAQVVDSDENMRKHMASNHQGEERPMQMLVRTSVCEWGRQGF